MGWTTPTDIQREAIPVALEGNTVCLGYFVAQNYCEFTQKLILWIVILAVFSRFILSLIRFCFFAKILGPKDKINDKYILINNMVIIRYTHV